MLINNTKMDSGLSNQPLLGNSGGETVGSYLIQVYPESNYTYTLQQMAAGDNGSQSLIFTAGGGYDDPLRNTIQSYDSYRSTVHNLWLNPLGGQVITDDLTYTNGNKPVQSKKLSSSAMPNMEVLFYHLQGAGDYETATMTLNNNINETTNYAVFPSIYMGSSSSSVWDNMFNIVIMLPLGSCLLDSSTSRWPLQPTMDFHFPKNSRFFKSKLTGFFNSLF